jgi:hypothetical protein
MTTAKKGAALADFRPLPAGRNPNKHTQHGMSQLDAAMSRQGYVAPMTASADGVVLDGNARLETVATKFPGVAPIIVEHDGTRPIIAVRTDIPNATDPMALDIIVSANRVAEADLAYDVDVLREFAAEGLDLGPFEFDAELLGKELQGGDGEPTYDSQWMIVLTCKDEAQQRDLLDRFISEGLPCKAVACDVRKN